jgi:hypothetical protein
MSPEELRAFLDRIVAEPLVWAAIAAIIAALTYAWHWRRKRLINHILGGARDQRQVFHPHFANQPLSTLEGELKQKIFDPAARERLIDDAVRRRKVDRETAIRIVLEQLDTENRRFG